MCECPDEDSTIVEEGILAGLLCILFFRNTLKYLTDKILLIDTSLIILTPILILPH